MLITEKPVIQNSSEDQNVVEYFSFFIDESAGMSRYIHDIIESYNRAIDVLIQQAQVQEMYVSLSTFTTIPQEIVPLGEVGNKEHVLKLRCFENFRPYKESGKQRFLYFAMRQQLSLLQSNLQTLQNETQKQVNAHGYIYTSGLDEQHDEDQIWAVSKLLNKSLRRNIEYNIVINDIFKESVQSQLLCPSNTFLTGK
jgi:hypothetical protein